MCHRSPERSPYAAQDRPDAQKRRPGDPDQGRYRLPGRAGGVSPSESGRSIRKAAVLPVNGLTGQGNTAPPATFSKSAAGSRPASSTCACVSPCRRLSAPTAWVRPGSDRIARSATSRPWISHEPIRATSCCNTHSRSFSAERPYLHDFFRRAGDLTIPHDNRSASVGFSRPHSSRPSNWTEYALDHAKALIEPVPVDFLHPDGEALQQQ